ncbi:MAG: methyltransferase [Prevotellaceae bacterium]|nr:methyltransferase [Prevotellaceae bacterium]
METFTFQHFVIAQDHCAMKVGTDGVLLGAWAPMPPGGRRILDIGTGTGVIALMMAQRFPGAVVDAIDIDKEACQQARENVADNGFGDRVFVQDPCALQNFNPNAASYENTDTYHLSQKELLQPLRYDAIVSNPPFFQNSLRNPDERRSLARHNDSLPFRDLARHSARLLEEHGLFSLIVPTEVRATVESECVFAGLSLCRRVGIRTTPRKPVKRWLLTFSKGIPTAIEEEAECLMNPDGSRSPWYSALVEDFYIR